MKHALIIERNMVIGCELSKRLTDLGFDSFDHVWTEEDAVAIADLRHPDLILVGDRLESDDLVEAALRICEKYDAPTLLFTAESVRSRKRVAHGEIFDGPFVISKIPEAIRAVQEHPQL